MGPCGALPFGALVGAFFVVAAKPVVHDTTEPLGTPKQMLTVVLRGIARVFDWRAAASTAKTLKAETVKGLLEIIFISTNAQLLSLAVVQADSPTCHV